MHTKKECSQSSSLNSCAVESNTDVNNDDSLNSSRGHISITPQMIRAAVKRLSLRKVYVDSNLIGEYLCRNYPVENNVKAFNEELTKKLDCAVRVGLIVRQGENAYCLPTFRQEANMMKTALSAFWEMYKDYNKSRISRNRNRGKRRSTFKKNSMRYCECSKNK